MQRLWLKWLPWRFIIRRVAQAHGFLDPIAIRSRLHRFAQPSEVMEPIELLRAGVLFHTRGLINTRAIQHNLDWIWPYWVERQFNPSDDAFIPRAFSITHVNLTHRNWTAVGLPNLDELPIVDPAGLVTPFWDSWSLDSWIVTEDGRSLLPSRLESVSQRLRMEKGIAVVTESSFKGLFLSSRVDVDLENHRPVCRLQLKARSDCESWAAIALRPYNPEGVSFIHDVSLSPDRMSWVINGHQRVNFNSAPDRHRFSDYHSGDVHGELPQPSPQESIRCNVGMATAAALFQLKANQSREILVTIPLTQDMQGPKPSSPVLREQLWEEALQGHCQLQIPEERFQLLYDAALRALILHTPGEVYPGPYTYKRFWFRDAAFMLNAMLCAGLTHRVEAAIDRFFDRQTLSGYFLSQEGEWDSNGEALWIIQRFCQLTGRSPKKEWINPIRKGGRWIERKRVSFDPDVLHAGLMPAGFSAEHLGPNDYYYWDNFWSVVGLRAAADLLGSRGERNLSEVFLREADDLLQAIERSLERTKPRQKRAGVPASPYRRMDAGAIGSLAAGYPLQLWSPKDPRLLDTVNFLMMNCFVNGGFFQDMIHSGINPYLTLHVAQVLLRAEDPRYFDLVKRIAEYASPTGQWPEAIHPRTGGGCMGDGQHMWASSEWVLMLRNFFVREESDRLILGSGIPGAWLEQEQPLTIGPTPTPYGEIFIRIDPKPEKVIVDWEAKWRGTDPAIQIHLPGFQPMVPSSGEKTVELKRRKD